MPKSFRKRADWSDKEQLEARLWNLWQVMDNCIQAWLLTEEGELPGGLNVKRRAHELYEELKSAQKLP